MDDTSTQLKNEHKEYIGLKRLLTPWRLKWYPRSLLSAIAVAFIIAVLSGNGASTLTGRLGGDYAAFYGAGRIIAEGEFGELYNWNRQLDSQKDLFPGDDKSFLPFMNPPYVALAYLPLSLLPYRLSYVIHTLLLVGALHSPPGPADECPNRSTLSFCIHFATVFLSCFTFGSGRPEYCLDFVTHCLFLACR
jgi:hypothetical protein